MVILPRARASAASSHRRCSASTALDDAGVDREQGEAVGLDVEERRALEAGGHAVFLRSRAASAISSSMRSAVVVLMLRSAFDARAAWRRAPPPASRNVALNPSSASYQSWLPGMA